MIVLWLRTNVSALITNPLIGSLHRSDIKQALCSCLMWMNTDPLAPPIKQKAKFKIKDAKCHLSPRSKEKHKDSFRQNIQGKEHLCSHSGALTQKSNRSQLSSSWFVVTLTGGQFPCTDDCQVTFVNLKCDSSKKRRRGRKSPSKEVSLITAEFEMEMKEEEASGAVVSLSSLTTCQNETVNIQQRLKTRLSLTFLPQTRVTSIACGTRWGRSSRSPCGHWGSPLTSSNSTSSFLELSTKWPRNHPGSQKEPIPAALVRSSRTGSVVGLDFVEHVLTVLCLGEN